MGKFAIQQLAEILIKKNGLNADESQNFVCAMFDIIKEGLETDKQVKIKGFGTFKIIDVDPRESVNVNTGERVLINGHQKITFTPDSVMKEMVNRPFSQFETVVINEGVDFSKVDNGEMLIEEMKEETAEENVAEEPKSDFEADNTINQQMALSRLNVCEENKNTEEKQKEEEKDKKEPKKEEPKEEKLKEELPKEETAEEQIAEEQNQSDTINYEEGETQHSYWNYLAAAVACILLMAASAYGGYMFGLEEGKHIEKTSQIAQYADYLEKQTAEIRAQRLAIEAKDSSKAIAQKTNPTKPDSMANQTAKPEDMPNVEPEQKKNEADNDFAHFNTKDVRIRTGAYVIVGIEKTITAKEGQTVGKIAQALLGPGMSCYIEAVNGVGENEKLKEGTKIKIPKLRHKKAVKK